MWTPSLAYSMCSETYFIHNTSSDQDICTRYNYYHELPNNYVQLPSLERTSCMCNTRMSLYGTVSAKIAPRLKCYKNAPRLNRYNFPTDNAIDFLFSTLHTKPFHYELLKLRSR